MVFEPIVVFAQVCKFQGYEPSIILCGIEGSLGAELFVDFLWMLRSFAWWWGHAASCQYNCWKQIDQEAQCTFDSSPSIPSPAG